MEVKGVGENYNNITEAALSHIKNQRHDFMNYLQVLYGYLQLDRREAAMEYIMKVNRRMLLDGKLGSLEDRGLYLAISEFIAVCYRHNVESELCCKESYISYGINTENIKEAIEAFSLGAEAIGDYLEKSGPPSPRVYMYLYGDESIKAFIAATEEQNLNNIYSKSWEEYNSNSNVKLCCTDSEMLLKIELI
jgi:hypothetical protein